MRTDRIFHGGGRFWSVLLVTAHLAAGARAGEPFMAEIVPQPPVASNPALSVVSPDGARVLVRNGFRTLSLCDAASGAFIRSFDLGLSAGPAAFSPDGSRILSGTARSVPPMDHCLLNLWDASTGKLLVSFEGVTGSVSRAAFSSDGTQVLAALGDEPQISTERIRSLGGQAAPVTSVAVSPDGARILSTAEGAALNLWDARSGKLVREFRPPEGVTLDDLGPPVAFLDGGAYAAAWDGAGAFAGWVACVPCEPRRRAPGLGRGFGKRTCPPDRFGARRMDRCDSGRLLCGFRGRIAAGFRRAGARSPSA